MQVCLNAIVRNEEARIERMLASVAPYITSWVIIDTGSSDDTKEKIVAFFKAKEIPGEIRQEPFVNWSQARNAALNWARKLRFSYMWDRLLLVDADMELVVKDPRWLDDAIIGTDFDMVQQAGPTHYTNRRIVGTVGKYVGPTHEYYDRAADGSISESKAYFKDYADGSNRPDKYKRDIALLRAGLKEEPDNARYMFYLACSYRDAGEPAKAAKWFERRIAAGGWNEEIWQSKVNLAHCWKVQKYDTAFVNGLLDAYNYRPTRPESMYDLAKWYRDKPDSQAAALACAEAVEHLPKSQDKLFVNDYVAQVGIKEEIAICSFYVPGKMRKGLETCADLAQHPSDYWPAIYTARQSMYYYLPPLAEFCPSFQWKNIQFKPPEDWVALNPSVCVHNDALWVNVRCVNYRIDEEGRYHIRNTETGEINRDNPINTRNFVLHLGSDPYGEAHPWEYECYYDSNLPVKFPLVIGFEDQRIWSWNNQLFGCAAVRQLQDDGIPEQVMSRLVVAKADKPTIRHADVTRMLRQERECEKNWAPILDSQKHLFMWRPGIVVTKEGKFDRQNQPDMRTDNLSGSSQVIPWRGGYLAILHIAQTLPGKDYKRYYYHRFIEYDKHLKVKRLSLPFYFNDKVIEFCAGLCEHPARNELVISYGYKDEEARIATVSEEDLEAFLCVR